MTTIPFRRSGRGLPSPRLLALAGLLAAFAPRSAPAVPAVPLPLNDEPPADAVLACPLYWSPDHPAGLFPHPRAPALESSIGLADPSGHSSILAARGWLEVGQPETALTLLDSAGGTTPEARLYRLGALAALERWDRFRMVLGEATEATVPAGCLALVERWRARWWMAVGEGAEADRAYERLMDELAPIGDYVQVWRLEDAALAGDLERGEGAWSRIDSSDLPGAVRREARSLLPGLYERGGQPDRARRWHLDLAAETRGVARAAHWLAAARLAEADGERAAADALRGRVLESEPAAGAEVVLDAGLRQRLRIEPVEAARLLLAAGRAGDAEPFASEALRSGGSEARRQQAHLLRAKIRAAQGDGAGAESDYDAFLSVWPDDPRVPDILYDRARLALEVQDGAAARARLHAFLEKHPSHSKATAALYLLADSYQDDRQTDPSFSGQALALFDRLARDHPGSHFSDRAYMRAAHLTYALGLYAEAERRYGAYGRGESTREARYWRARSIEREGGDPARAREIYRSLSADADDYYALLARGRMAGRSGTTALLEAGYRPGPPVERGEEGSVLLADPAGRAASLLLALGERRWAHAELERALGRLSDPDLLRAWAPALALWGFPDLTLRIGVRLGAHEWPGELYAHPLGFAASVDAEAQEHGLDVALVLALIRQESMFAADAVSPAGARGLMQVMPATGREIAAATGWRGYDPALLFDPAVSLHFGAHYLRDQAERFEGFWPAVLAAYNGGPDNVAVWWDFPERTLDPELWIDRIPYKETREYVRKVIVQRAAYERLYGSATAAR